MGECRARVRVFGVRPSARVRPVSAPQRRRGALVALPPAPARREPLTAPERTNPAQFRPAAPW